MVGAPGVSAVETPGEFSPCVSPLEEEELLREPSPSADDIEEPMDQEIVDLPPKAPAVPEPKPGPSGYLPPVSAPTPTTDDRWDFMLREMQ